MRCLYSTLAPKHRLSSWVRFLALSAAWPDLEVGAVTIGRGRRERHGPPRVRVSLLRPLGTTPAQRRSAATAALDELVELYDRGMCEPLPLVSETSAAWAEARHVGADAPEAAGRAWTSGRGFDREDREREHVLVFGGVRPFESILAAPTLPEETGPGWAEGEPTRFGCLARRLWDRLLDQEQPVVTPEPSPFDLCGPLPGPGVTVLEASAGTGKTYTIAGLTARFVAAGVPIDEILAVTFTRHGHRRASRSGASSSGLRRAGARSLPRHRGVTTEVEISGASPGDGLPAEVADRRRRLADALARVRRRHHHDHARVLSAGAGQPRRRRARSAWAPRWSKTPTMSSTRPSTICTCGGCSVGAFRRLRRWPWLADRQEPWWPIPATPLEPPSRRQRSGSPTPPGRRRSTRGGPPPARPQSPHLRRLAGAAAGRAGRPEPRRRRGLPVAAPALPGGARRRVPGHRSGAVGRGAPGLRRRHHDPGADRRPQAGHLLLPRRGCLRLSRRRPRRRPPLHPGRELAQ